MNETFIRRNACLSQAHLNLRSLECTLNSSCYVTVTARLSIFDDSVPRGENRTI